MVITNAAPSRNYWQPPLQDVYKLNFDTVVFLNLNCSGLGAIIRNSASEVMARMSAKGDHVHNREEAEAFACRKVVEFSMEAGFSNLVIEGDNSNVMRAISSSAANNSLLGHIPYS